MVESRASCDLKGLSLWIAIMGSASMVPNTWCTTPTLLPGWGSQMLRSKCSKACGPFARNVFFCLMTKCKGFTTAIRILTLVNVGSRRVRHTRVRL